MMRSRSQPHGLPLIVVHLTTTSACVRAPPKESAMKFEGTQSYVATDDLKLAVNAAITLQRPCW